MKNFLITLACIIFGPILIWRGLSDLVTASQARSWPTAQGVIQSADMTTSHGRKNRTTYTPVVKYSYEVGGANYVGDHVNYGARGTSSYEDAMAILAHYRNGQHLPVRYDPKNPKVAVLEAGTTIDNWLLFGIGVLMTVFAIFSSRSLWRNLKKNDYAPTSGF